MDEHKRSLSKTGTWRIVALLADMSIFYAFTGQLGLSLAFGIVGVAVKTLLYYVHERAWSMTHWGVADE